MTGPLMARRERPRRRITPNANTSTTTMISTHNHVDMAASLVGAGQFKLTLLPPTQANNSVTARQPPGPGSTAALRAGPRDPCTPRPARRSGLAGRVPDRPPTTPRPGGAEPFGPRPASPAPTTAPSTTRAEDPGRRHPTQGDHTEPTGGYGEAEKRLPCLGGGTIQAWLCRCAMADAAPPAPDRWCAPSATPEPAPRTAAPPSSPGTTPLGAARCTKDGTDRR